jgi:hypothetical protein
MSSSRPPRSPDAGTNPTRQMLDELDALMERMLSLPVDELDTSLPAPQPSLLTLEQPGAGVADVPSDQVPGDEMPGQVAVILAPGLPRPTPAEPVDQVADVPSEAQAGWQPAPQESPPPHLQGPHMRPVPAGKIIVGRLSAPPSYSPPLLKEAGEKTPQVNEPANEQPVDILAAPPLPGDVALPPLIVKPPVKGLPRRRSLVRTGLQLLLRLNQAFDHATTWLGETGRLLRSARGRSVLGLAGAALLALAIVWCLHDWLGWTWFKVSLE